MYADGQEANDGCPCYPAKRRIRHVDDVGNRAQVDIDKADEVQITKSRAESPSKRKELAFWWMGDALDM